VNNGNAIDFVPNLRLRKRIARPLSKKDIHVGFSLFPHYFSLVDHLRYAGA
jgi:hypothetical protein